MFTRFPLRGFLMQINEPLFHIFYRCIFIFCYYVFMITKNKIVYAFIDSQNLNLGTSKDLFKKQSTNIYWMET